MKKFFGIIIVAILFGLTLTGALAADEPSKQTIFLSKKQVSSLMRGQIHYGNTLSNLGVIEYSDTQCPYCKKQYNEGTLLKMDLAFSGGIDLVYKPVTGVNHALTKNANALLICSKKLGGASLFSQVYDTLITQNEKVTAHILEEAKTGKYADWSRCMSSGLVKHEQRKNDREFSHYTNLLQSSEGTPSTLLINKDTGEAIMVAGAYPVEHFVDAARAILD